MLVCKNLISFFFFRMDHGHYSDQLLLKKFSPVYESIFIRSKITTDSENATVEIEIKINIHDTLLMVDLFICIVTIQDKQYTVELH